MQEVELVPQIRKYIRRYPFLQIYICFQEGKERHRALVCSMLSTTTKIFTQKAKYEDDSIDKVTF